MCENHRTVPLGFSDQEVPEGTHLCLIFSDEEERIDSLMKFVLSGLNAGERAACFSNHVTEPELREFCQSHGLAYDEKKAARAVSLTKTDEVYFAEGLFDPDRMLNLLTTFYRETGEMGFSGARVIGEMSPKVESVPGGDRLLEYESRVSILLRDHPVTAVCQYDANSFDGATIMEVLKVHPQMLVNGSVVNNPFFIEPETYLKGLNA